MRTVWKFTIARVGEATRMLPEGAQFVAGRMGAYDTIDLWAEVDTEAERRDRRVRVYGTGHEQGDVDEFDHVATVFDGPFVWHVYVER